MSKKSKAASKQKNLQAKRARKSANRSKYQSLAASGDNSKKKHGPRNGKPKINVFGHSTENCGNTGCERCVPRESVIIHGKKIIIFN